MKSAAVLSSIQESAQTEPTPFIGRFGRGAGRTKSAYKRHILPRSHPHSKTGYALENQTVFELTGMRKKAPLFPANFTPLNRPILETTGQAVQVIHYPDQGAI